MFRFVLISVAMRAVNDLSIARSTDGLTVRTGRLMQVLVLQISREGRWNIRFMYEPAFQTLIDGFSVYSQRNMLNFTATNNMPLNRSEINCATSVLQNGDVFIWLGLAGSGEVPWVELRGRGVYTVYYRTEPKGPCMFRHHGVDETWETHTET